MSKDIIVLAPNGRRQKVHCSPDTSILQILEDVCQKQGFQPSHYNLKHHNQVLDLTNTIRFSNLPNKATLEMVEAGRKREETNVIIGLLLEDGERRTAAFSPNTSLYDMITSLAPSELSALQNPTILYMRQEVTGLPALRDKTLRQLGLIGGRAILRLLSKAEELRQANVSTIFRCPQSNKKNSNTLEENPTAAANVEDVAKAGPSDIKKVPQKTLNTIAIMKEEKDIVSKQTNQSSQHGEEAMVTDDLQTELMITESPTPNISSFNSLSQENLERRLKIEEEVTFLGAQKAIAFMQPDTNEEELSDLPDDFYELTIEEVRKLYHDLQQNRLVLENTPLMSSAQREEIAKQISQQSLNEYKNVVVRIQFPDHIILQGIFLPTNTITDVTNFIKAHLQNSEKGFHIFTTPLKETLDPKMTLLEAKFVPCIHMHFKWLEEDVKQPYLKEDIYANMTSSDAASLLASKYRAPSRRKLDITDDSQKASSASASSSKNSKVPKWFKN